MELRIKYFRSMTKDIWHGRVLFGNTELGVTEDHPTTKEVADDAVKIFEASLEEAGEEPAA